MIAALAPTQQQTAQEGSHHIDLLWCGGSATEKPERAYPVETKQPRGNPKVYKNAPTLTTRTKTETQAEESEVWKQQKEDAHTDR